MTQLAEIDNLIEKMVRARALRMVLADDQPIRVFGAEREGKGPVLPRVRLRALIEEIVPESLRPNLRQDCRCQFPYQSPLGIFQVEVERSHDAFSAVVAPLPDRHVEHAASDAIAPASTRPPVPPTDPARPTAVSQPPMAQARGRVAFLPFLGSMIGCLLGLWAVSIGAVALTGGVKNPTSAGPVWGLVAVCLVVIASTLWIYFDSRALGVRKGRMNGPADLSRPAWVAACLLLWGIAFPAYLVARRQYRRMTTR